MLNRRQSLPSPHLHPWGSRLLSMCVFLLPWHRISQICNTPEEDEASAALAWKKAGSDVGGKQSCCCSSLCRGQEGRMTVVTPWSVLQAPCSLKLETQRQDLSWCHLKWNLAPLFKCSSDFVEALIVCSEAFPGKSNRNIQTKTWDFWEALLAAYQFA